jgi:hypothetical protein
MATYQNSNQFLQTPVLGQVSEVVNPSIISVKINPSSAATKIQAGQAVKIIDGTANEILADVVASATADKVFGVIVYNPKKNTYVKGDTVEIAMEGSVLFMETSAAVARGATVATDWTGPTVAVDAVASHQQTGLALDKATAANQLIRVLVKPSTNAAA